MEKKDQTTSGNPKLVPSSKINPLIAERLAYHNSHVVRKQLTNVIGLIKLIEMDEITKRDAILFFRLIKKSLNELDQATQDLQLNLEKR